MPEFINDFFKKQPERNVQSLEVCSRRTSLKSFANVKSTPASRSGRACAFPCRKLPSLGQTRALSDLRMTLGAFGSSTYLVDRVVSVSPETSIVL